MGWFDTVLTIGTTIGRVAGALSGAGEAKGVDFGAPGGAEPTLGQVVFFNDSNSVTWALNQSTDTGVGIFFPPDPTLTAAPAPVIIEPASKVAMSSTFASCADADIDGFTIVPFSWAGADGKAAPSNGDVNIHASTTQPVPVSGTVTFGQFTASLNTTERTVIIGVTGALTLTGIVLLNIRGAGSTAVRIINAIRKSSSGKGDDPQHITVDIPNGIDISAGLTSIEIDAAVGGLAAVTQCEPLTHRDYERLKHIAEAR